MSFDVSPGLKTTETEAAGQEQSRQPMEIRSHRNGNCMNEKAGASRQSGADTLITINRLSTVTISKASHNRIRESLARQPAIYSIAVER